MKSVFKFFFHGASAKSKAATVFFGIHSKKLSPIAPPRFASAFVFCQPNPPKRLKSSRGFARRVREPIQSFAEQHFVFSQTSKAEPRTPADRSSQTQTPIPWSVNAKCRFQIAESEINAADLLLVFSLVFVLELACCVRRNVSFV